MPSSFYEKVKAKLAGKFTPKVKVGVDLASQPSQTGVVLASSHGPDCDPILLKSMADFEKVFGKPKPIDPAVAKVLKEWKDHVEGIPEEQQPHVAQMLENASKHVEAQKKQLLGYKAEDLQSLFDQGAVVWAPYMPLYTTPALTDVPEQAAKAYADKSINEKLVSVQPLTKKPGGIFFLDFEVGGEKAKVFAETLQRYGFKVAGKL
jgi:hypothetical protein